MPHRPALVVVDVQVGMFDPEGPAHDSERLLTTLSDLIERARVSGSTVIFIQHCGSPESGLEKGTPGWPIHPSIAPDTGDWVIEKSEPDSFQGTDLDARLRQDGISSLVVCGIATEYCVDTTVRGAFERGYDVVLVRDGHSTWANGILTAEQIVAHHNLTLARFAEVRNADDVQFGSGG